MGSPRNFSRFIWIKYFGQKDGKKYKLQKNTYFRDNSNAIALAFS